MPCFHPIRAFQTVDGTIVFSERGRIYRSLDLPCGQCIGCRLERARQWSVRCVQEASIWQPWNSFVTLTYDDSHVPDRNDLDPRAFDLFLKRLRKEVYPNLIRYYMCGEYGGANGRPHFHALLFNCYFDDLQYWQTTASGKAIFRSKTLERLWPYGFSSVGTVTFESAGYIARYCTKKVSGDLAPEHYRRVDLSTGEIFYLRPEYNRMSLKPGIGYLWFRKFQTDVYPHDYVVINGVRCKPPRYYDRLYERMDPIAFENVSLLREQDARSRFDDNTQERLIVKEAVVQAAVSQSGRERF